MLTGKFGIPPEKDGEFSGVFRDSLGAANLVKVRGEKRRVLDVSQGAGVEADTAGCMGVALANLSTSSASITATVWDSGTNLGSQTITAAGGGHTSFVLPTQIPLTAGKHGIVRFQSNATGGITGLGLRFSPFGTFTSVPTIVGQ